MSACRRKSSSSLDVIFAKVAYAETPKRGGRAAGVTLCGDAPVPWTSRLWCHWEAPGCWPHSTLSGGAFNGCDVRARDGCRPASGNGLCKFAQHLPQPESLEARARHLSVQVDRVAVLAPVFADVQHPCSSQVPNEPPDRAGCEEKDLCEFTNRTVRVQSDVDEDAAVSRNAIPVVQHRHPLPIETTSGAALLQALPATGVLVLKRFYHQRQAGGFGMKSKIGPYPVKERLTNSALMRS